jgi:hypothetical protein
MFRNSVVQWGDMSTDRWRPSVRYYETILLNVRTSFLWPKASRAYLFFGSMSGNALMELAGAYSSSGSSEQLRSRKHCNEKQLRSRKHCYEK